MPTTFRTLAVSLAAALLLGLPVSSPAGNYNYEEIANNPFQLNGKMIKAEGVVERLKLNQVRDWGYYRFNLTEPGTKRYVSVNYYVSACGRQIDNFNFPEGASVAVVGKFTRTTMTKVTGYLGNLYVNEDKRDAACKEERARRRKR